MENNKNLRNIVLTMLTETLDKGEFSHNIINKVFSDSTLSYRDRAFINRLYSGTLEKIVLIDYAIGQFSSVPMKKMKAVIRNILRMSVYQLHFMDSVPAHSCIDEAVKLTRKRGFSNLTGFVNGILRKIQREFVNLDLPENVKVSMPEWLYKLIIEQYGKEDGNLYFQSGEKKRSETIVRFNLMKATSQQIIDILEKDGCKVVKYGTLDSAYLISGFESLTSLKAFKQGLIIMQDISSMIAVETAAADTVDNKLIIDVCAAPGGKSLFMAEKFPQATVISRDLTEYKISLIKENVKRLGIKNIKTEVHDALINDESYKEKADIVIADLPCSGLGVIGKKPDILYRVKESDLENLAMLQRNILDVVQNYVKPGGILLYSTCTVNKKENEENTAWFLKKYGFILESEKQFIPGKDDTDGFYIARLKKK